MLAGNEIMKVLKAGELERRVNVNIETIRYVLGRVQENYEN
jgi:hypothetical protein